MDTSELLARITERRKAVGIRSERALCLKAGRPAKVDSIRSIRRGHAPRREVLRVLAVALECPLSYLEEVAPDVRLNARADDKRQRWIDIYDHMPQPKQGGLIEAGEAFARLAIGPESSPEKKTRNPKGGETSFNFDVKTDQSQESNEDAGAHDRQRTRRED